VTKPSKDSDHQARADEEIFDAIRAGDAEAWRELVGRYERLVMSVPLGLGLSPHDAEEVFQATWRTLYEHVRSIRQPGRIAFWIRTTARRESWRQGQKRSQENLGSAELDSLTALPSSVPDPADELGRREAHAEVVAGLDQLGPRCRLLLTRLFLESPAPSYDEVSEELDMPVGSIGPTRIRCLEKLAMILGAKGADL